MRISDWSSDVCSSDLNGGPLAALPDIAAKLQCLFEGQPIGGGEALTHGAGPKAEDVDPTIGDPIVPERNGRPTAPRLHPRLGARFEHRKNVVGDGLINVDPVRFLSHFPHSFRRSRCLRPAALTRWRSAGWGGGSKIDGSGAGGATREAPARASAPELAELVGPPGPVAYASDRTSVG